MLGRHLSLRRNLDRWAVAAERSLNPSGSAMVGEPLVNARVVGRACRNP